MGAVTVECLRGWGRILLRRLAEFLGVDVRKIEKSPLSLVGIEGSVTTYVMKDTKLVFTTEDGGEHMELIDALVVEHDLRLLSEELRRGVG